MGLHSASLETYAPMTHHCGSLAPVLGTRYKGVAVFPGAGFGADGETVDSRRLSEPWARVLGNQVGVWGPEDAAAPTWAGPSGAPGSGPVWGWHAGSSGPRGAWRHGLSEATTQGHRGPQRAWPVWGQHAGVTLRRDWSGRPGGMVSGLSQLSPHSRPREVGRLGLRGLAGDPCPPSSPAHPQRAAQRVSRGPGPSEGPCSPNTTPQTGGGVGLETPDLCSPTGWGRKPEVKATRDHALSTGSRGRPSLPHLAAGSGHSWASGPIPLTSAPASQGLLLRVCVPLLLLVRTLAAGCRGQPDSPECWLPVDIYRLIELTFLNPQRPFSRMSPSSLIPRLGHGHIRWGPPSSPRQDLAPASPPPGGESLGQTPRSWATWTPWPEGVVWEGETAPAAPRFLQGDTDSLREEGRAHL